MKTENMFFSISGEFITNIARDRLREGSYQGALNILGSINDLSLEQQISILLGEQSLSGENNLTLIKATQAEREQMQQWHQEYYGRLFFFENKLYEPYAIVSAWNRDDLPTSNSKFSAISYKMIDLFDTQKANKMHRTGLHYQLKEHLHARSLFYADNPSEDWAVSINKQLVPSGQWLGDVVVLFKEFSEQAPFWANAFYAKTPYDAVEQSIKSYRRLESRGAQEDDFEDKAYDFLDMVEDKQKKSFFKPLSTPLSDKEADEAFEKKEQEYIQQVIQYANEDKVYGWKEFIDNNEEPPKSMKVPYRAFLHFAVGRAIHSGVATNCDLPEYEAFFPRGWKMMNDDPLHTDVWLGAGLDIRSAYDIDSWEHKFFFKKVFEMQSVFLEDFDFNIINSAKLSKFSGTTVNIHNFKEVPKGKRILVIPHLGVEFETVALQCDAIITETGGKLAHLATVGRETGIPIVRVEDAVIKFALPQHYQFDFETGKFEMIDKKNKKGLKF